ncbi:hypothetical protein AM588_10004155 [Phytophthora nicotianae]|uniref:Uncharacterized protein n=1 Tax=Phytophthora nicotianae TaxID=4792 RepID=A0A0W8CW51_PHYNI|nr:hypothetical protein AM588_10004155 [Phytophthora nicotianae]
MQTQSGSVDHKQFERGYTAACAQLPSTDVPTFAELYAIDLLGMMISTCTVQFFWSYVTSLTVKHRNLAPRLLGAALKYNPEKEWLRNVFLRESGSDQELSTAWLLGTLDVAALNSTPIVFKLEDVPFGVITQERTSHQSRVRDSDYWVMLTDGIIYHLLRNDSVGFGAMDPLVLQLLREVASTCKFHSSVRANEAAFHDADTLYDLHLDVSSRFVKVLAILGICTVIPNRAIARDEPVSFKDGEVAVCNLRLISRVRAAVEVNSKVVSFSY